MRMLPVIDLKEGMVVHAVAGRRHEYQPICSQLVSDAQPSSVAKAFVDHCGFSQVYVADLDAISGAEPSWDAYDQIAQTGLHLLIDAGIVSTNRAQQLAGFARRSGKLAAAVVGSESAPDAQTLISTLEIHGPEQTIFSLDLRHGRPIVADSFPRWSLASPHEIVGEVVAMGYHRFIILDLAAVGAGTGPVTIDLCRRLRREHTAIELISGGGVRHAEDVRSLCNAGCDRVLVASALHSGRLSDSIGLNGERRV